MGTSSAQNNPAQKISAFFETQREKRNVKFLGDKFNEFLQFLREINMHIEYELELGRGNVDENFIDSFKADTYLPKINSKILLPFNTNENSLLFRFFQLIICFDYSEFTHINEKLYSEIIFRMLENAAKNKACDMNHFVRKIYEFKGNEASREKVQLFIKQMYQGRELEEQDLSLELVNTLLLQNRITGEKMLKKTLRKIALPHFLIFCIFPLALGIFVLLSHFLGWIDFLAVFSAFGTSYVIFRDNFEIPVLIFAFVMALIVNTNIVSLCFRKRAVRHLKSAIERITVAFDTTSETLFKKLLPTYGNQIKRLLP